MSGNPLVNMMGNAMMQNNPFFGLINMFKSGGNVMPFVNQMKKQNPQFGEAIDAINGKDQSQVNDFLAQKAKERGVDLSQVARQVNMPKDVAARFGINMD